MEFRQNLAFVWMSMPVVVAVTVAWIFPALILPAVLAGFVLMVVLLFYQMVVKQWIVLHFHLWVIHTEPTPKGTARSRHYSPWPIIWQAWSNVSIREFHDPDSDNTVGYLKLGLGGVFHPVYNRGERVKLIILHYTGDFYEHVKDYPLETQTGYRSVVVDVKSAAFMWLREITAALVTDPEGSGQERVADMPAWIPDEYKRFYTWCPHFDLIRGDADAEREARNE